MELYAARLPETNSINSFVKRKLNTYDKLLTFFKVFAEQEVKTPNILG